MTNRLSPSVSTIASPHLSAPHPSQDISLHRIPDVFVIPPEEEQDINPPFQYLDASQAGLATSSPDMDAVDVALGFFQHADGNRAPVFHRYHPPESQDTVIMPKRSRSRHSMRADRDFLDSGISRSHSSTRSSLDEDVVEIIKVRRNEGMSDVSDGKHMMRRSKTFRARASQALRSIKNVGKAGRKPITDIWPTNRDENIDCAQHDMAGKPPLSRRKSGTLSQFFGTTRSSRRSSPNVPPDVAEPPISHESSVPTPHRTFASLSNKRTGSNTFENMNPGMTTKVPLSKHKSFRNRVSALDLQRLFTSSTSTSETEEAAHTAPRASKRGAVAFSLSSRFPSKHTTPTAAKDVFSPSAQPHCERPSLVLSKSESNTSSVLRREFEEDIVLEDSFEMRLDSLHFDSLHFDPEELELELRDL